ncbi:hypothetical protein [Bordetella genomosp. 12]|uniref:Uncharacterized protein n=1 Tax=Bordetella genomosp. 12 TaxID=463035 RepID=A0A261VAU9_9BORD|nr:hypothetical protein [Bordetella genomosp. 12]OZI70712.1 hypothetical protein CAL22_12375 [Bordetella genomosp. 12]
MPYETLFWSMAALVAFALGAGVAAGHLRTLGSTLRGVSLAAVLALAAVAHLSSSNETAGMAALLAVAAGLFCLVIACACALLTRRVRHRKVGTL